MSNRRLVIGSGVAAGAVCIGLWMSAQWRGETAGGRAEARELALPGKERQETAGARGAAGAGQAESDQADQSRPSDKTGTPDRPGSGMSPSAGTPAAVSAVPQAVAGGQASPTAAAASAAAGEPGKKDEPDKPEAAVAAVSLADLLEAGADLSDPAQRAAVVEKLRISEEKEKAEAEALADQLGLPKRVTRPDGSVVELMRFENGQPKYVGTRNANAAISTGADVLQKAPYSLTGAGMVIGLWDGGSALESHQEFGGRVTSKDGADADDHATHVAGTMIAAGVVAAAKGMAPEARVDSYDWNSDLSEMTARGAAFPGEEGKIALSNHSYGLLTGWYYTGLNSPKWAWYGSGTTAAGTDPDFGRYSSESRDNDALAVSLPYYLIVRAAGNDRTDDPAAGEPVSLSTSTSASRAVSYNSALHPAGDGDYKQGYETISYDETAKNILTVGAVTDAVSGGLRSVARASVLSFSSWGPTDDGRIKPDVVANGDQLYSSTAEGNSAYASYSGTSMATPNATGSAALLVQLYGKLFPGGAMRASTLKGLLIHTADDLGTPGPDYQTGWGLVNVKSAADLLQAWHDQPGRPRVLEDRVATAGSVSRQYSLAWDGVSPIRATLCWTDPAGTTTGSADSRTARLVNNLDLTVTGPEGTVYSPWVMPYVGNWSAAMLSAPAVTGKNNTDNVEQVLVPSPETAGLYTVRVTVSGSLTGGSQNFSLLLSGGAPGGTLPAPLLTSISPDSATSGTVTLSLAGSGFLLGSRVTLEKAGQTAVAATGEEIVSDSIRCRVAVGGLRSGDWDVVVTNPDGQRAELAASFTVTGPIWEDSLEETDTSGWTDSASFGTASPWALSTARSHSATHSFYSSMPGVRNVADLYSPPIDIPAEAENLRLTFWHSYTFSTSRAGGVLEYSLDGGTVWTDVAAAGSGASFTSGGYNAVLKSSGSSTSTTTANPLDGRSGWSGAATSFTQAVLDLKEVTKFAGKSLRLRWRLATGKSSGTGSTGYWYVDDVVLAGSVPAAAVLPPSLTAAASASPRIVTGTSAELKVGVSDGGDGSTLTYTWSSTGDFLAPVQFSDNGTSTASSTTVTFAKAGHYALSVSARSADNLSVTSSVEVTVEATATRLEITPAPGVRISKGGTQAFTLNALDQFGMEMSVPSAVEWAATGGTISEEGLFTAGNEGGLPFTVSAVSGPLSAASGGRIIGQNLVAWEQSYFGEAAVLGGSENLRDEDHDSVVNLLEYALGSDPTTPDQPPQPVYDGESLSMTFLRPRELPDAVYEVQVSPDLRNWSPVPLEVVTEGDPERVKAVFTIPDKAAGQYFMRLKVTTAE